MEQPQRYAVSAARDGARRAGRVWRRKPTIVSAADLTPTELEMLQADPAITVAPWAPEWGNGEAAPTAEELLAAMTLDEMRARLVRRACRELVPGEDFTASGMPEVSALQRLTGLRAVSAAERDRAWLDHVEAGNAAAAAEPAGGAV